MVQSIELLFDERTEARVRSCWDALAAAGLPSLAGHEGATSRPHVTVAVAEGGLEDAMEAVGAVAAGWSLGERGSAVEIGAPLLFGGHRHRWVLARQIVPSRSLLTLHAAVHQAIDESAPAAQVLAQTRPDGWSPHVSLARRIPADRLPEALAAMDVQPVPCRFSALRLWDSATQTVTAL